MAEICEAITLKVVVPPPIILIVDFQGEFLSSSDGEDYKRGYEEGHEKGYTEGEIEGYTKGYSEGKKSEYYTYWNNLQQNGERTDYAYAFYGEPWNDSIYKPIYPFKCSAVIYMFYKSHITNIGDIDASQATRAEHMFGLCMDLQSLGEIDLRNAYIGYTFFNCKALKTIKKLVLSPVGTTGFNSTFVGCESLENIVIEGKIGSSVDFKSSSKLTTESVDSIGNAVIDLTGQTSQTVIFHKDVIAKMSDEQKAVFTNKNWTLVSSN